ncbi:MAG: hypothetical protein PHC29_03395 [Candidatus Omnitrophica bacterium]|nr:hypothetical protein [Candidatus Omnitrophota bacterium]
MNKINLFLLIVISLIAICVDCYAGYFLFFMTAMPIGYYLSPILLLIIVISAPTIFIVSIINLFKFKKWAYYAFFIITVLMHLFLIGLDMYFLNTKIIKYLKIEQFIPIISLSFFVIYFMLPSTKSMFKYISKT